MSFSEDPYKHVSVTFRDGSFGWECNGCGADSRQTFGHTDTIAEISDAFWKHIRNSHKMLPEDTKDWS